MADLCRVCAGSSTGAFRQLRASYARPVQVVFAVTGVERARSFYEHAFGWPRNERITSRTTSSSLPPDGGALGLYRREGYAEEIGGRLRTSTGRVSRRTATSGSRTSK